MRRRSVAISTRRPPRPRGEADETVVMTHPISVRIRDLGVAERLKREAGARGRRPRPSPRS
jgi:hypothetical protein